MIRHNKNRNNIEHQVNFNLNVKRKSFPQIELLTKKKRKAPKNEIKKKRFIFIKKITVFLFVISCIRRWNGVHMVTNNAN